MNFIYKCDPMSRPQRRAGDYTPLTDEQYNSASLYGTDWFFETLLRTEGLAELPVALRVSFMNGALVAMHRQQIKIDSYAADNKKLREELDELKSRVKDFAQFFRDALEVN